MYGKQPEVKSLFRWRGPNGRWRSGLTLSSAKDAIVGKWIGEVQLDQGQLDQLEIEANKLWQIDEIV